MEKHIKEKYSLVIQMITRRRCKVCQHEDRAQIEEMVNSMTKTCDDIDIEFDWPSGTTARHMRNHTQGYDDASNPQCAICTHPERAKIETDITEGTVPPSEVAAQLGTTDAQVRKHMRSHLQPLVQKSAATQIARREIDEIDMLSANLQRLDGKLDELFNMPTHTTRELDSLTKLAKEIRESLKYLMEFKGKLIHRRQDTIIVAQMQIVQEVLAQNHPQVWLDVKEKMKEKLQ